MTPIKAAILWHQHQPYYKDGGEYRLPWVRLHSTKDYLEMAEHLSRVPAMHATINLVPSLIEQIEDYANGAEDILLRLAKKTAASLTSDERAYVIRGGLQANRERVIARSQRYSELAAKAPNLNDQEITDLTVHHLLGWTGEFARETEPYATLIEQDRNFSQEQKQKLIDAHRTIMNSIVEAHRQLAARGNIELSATPFYHPILPLLCDTNAAQEAVSDIALPEQQFSSREDAEAQVREAVSFHSQFFDGVLNGMWPAEGSISDEALGILAANHIRWTASDETVLAHSLSHPENHGVPNEYGEYEKYFPRRYESDGTEIIIFFRDHHLSDKIGFDYARWNADDAVEDVINQIKRVRSEILASFSEDILRDACISIILDGENCWEYYERNGREFLSQLYESLTNEPEIQLVTFSEAVEEIKHIRPIEHIVAGSWIGGNFRIWIGHPEKNRAWENLRDAHNALTLYAQNGNFDLGCYECAREALMKAEGSDWFWWFGDDHSSDDRPLFDELFRSHLRTVYQELKLPEPSELSVPIIRHSISSEFSSMHRGE